MGLMQFGSHFYDSQGKPQYEADLRTAKKFDYFPSVTTALKVIYKYELERWKQEQILMSALTSKIQDGESEREYISRIIEDAMKEGTDAANFGTNVHDILEKMVKREDIDYREYTDREILASKNVLKEFIKPCINLDVVHAEKEYVNIEHGYGGRVDLHGEIEGSYSVLDWKTQKVKWREYKKPTDDPYEIKQSNGTYLRPVPAFYDDFKWQLGAGKKLVEANHDVKVERGYSILINSDPDYPQMFFIEVYTAEALDEGFETFNYALNLYRKVKNFPYRRDI